MTSKLSDSALMQALLAGLLLAMLAVAQTALAVSLPAEVARADQRDPATWTHKLSQPERAQTNPDAPCFHHEPGAQCAPCQHCSTAVAEVPEPLEFAGADTRERSPPAVTNYFPSALFKPPRLIR